MNVKYVGPAKDYSGYGEAVRHDIAALLAAGVGVSGKYPRYTLEIADFGRLGELLDNVEYNAVDYDIVILHTTPNVYRQYMEEGKYHIARVFWETDKLPEDFARNVQLCDEVWTGSEYNKQAIIKAGVTKPIHIIPEAIDTQIDTNSIKPYKVVNPDGLALYSIFEWTERKNPLALLEAYFLEFQNNENVSLTLKTYVDNFSRTKKEEIDHYIRKLKNKLNLPSYPKLFMYRNLMDRGQIYRFHKTYRVFVSAHRGEGWGIPQMEAMLVGNPIVSTNCGGIHEYLQNNETAFLIDSKLVPVDQTTRNPQWYAPDQNWAEIDKTQLRMALRYIYENPEIALSIGRAGQKKVKELFSLDTVGYIMKNRLIDIDINKT